ncbi:hypothetical protein ACFFS2_14060 [Streptomyces aurantiacus]|uniref:Uncharacterized protein n=1 Tax=Streptomyces aurantiacus TaxID=47760 RepID=A0A7G1NW10_9ACTN|nr:hypothetical protein [Streptomyces aurantiacus]BCL25786.1 hypothetical protein GCM10017557_06450 [Streptomyces aurantiacus]
MGASIRHGTRRTRGGGAVLECDSIEEAVEAAVGAVEVRAFREDEDAEGEIRRLDAELTWNSSTSGA